MGTQVVTPELRQWIVQQAGAGHSIEQVLGAMTAGGWDEEVALDALELTLGDHLRNATAAQNASGSQARQLATRLADRDANLPPPSEVPGRHLSVEQPVVRAADRDVRIVATLGNPRVVVIADLLSGAECDELIEQARGRLARSETVHTRTGSSEVNDARTSLGMFFRPGETPVVARLEARIAALLQWPVENGEGLQILRYRPGAEYKPHYDYFDPIEKGTPTILKRGGQRVGSVVVYLQQPEGGGATVFPDVDFAVAAQRGHACFFSYDRPHPSTRSLHGGAPVTEGEKWVATKWLREGVFK